MCHWLDEHPEAEPKTMRDHMNVLNRFGFDVHYKLTSKQENIKGGFDKFMEITGGGMSITDGPYEMESMTQPPRKCEFCKQLALRRCAKCNAPYCSRECQLKDWKNHKKVCRAIQDAQEL